MFADICRTAADIVWGPALIAAVLGVGFMLSVGSGFFQLRRFGHIVRHTLGSVGQREKGGVSPFAAMATALGGTMGAGNIVGVATAIALGGPGSIFWMWAAALVGMMTKLAEVELAVHFRRKTADGYAGGPMYYMEKALGSRGMAVLFSLLCALGALGMGATVQSNAIAGAMEHAFGLPPLLTGILTAAAVTAVSMGGVRRVTGVSAFLVPLMTVAYALAALAVIALNARALPGAFGEIVKGAFSLPAASGGAGGYTMRAAVRYGVARGIYTNEAGLGSAPSPTPRRRPKNRRSRGCGAFWRYLSTLWSAVR
jgi:AGCS family alanine or glycine:cation symporter